MILDLKAFVDETLDIRLADGMILHVPKPSQKMVLKILAMHTIDLDTPEEKALAALNSLVSDILNSNIDGVNISADSVKAIGENSKIAIVNAYSEFMKKLQSNPTMPCPNRPEKRKAAGIWNFFRAFRK